MSYQLLYLHHANDIRHIDKISPTLLPPKPTLPNLSAQAYPYPPSLTQAQQSTFVTIMEQILFCLTQKFNAIAFSNIVYIAKVLLYYMTK